MNFINRASRRVSTKEFPDEDVLAVHQSEVEEDEKREEERWCFRALVLFGAQVTNVLDAPGKII